MMLFLIKSTFSLGLFLALYHIVLSKESTFRFNRFYLLFALVFSFSVPFISIPKVIPTVQENSAKIWNNFESDQTNEIISFPTTFEEPNGIAPKEVAEGDIAIATSTYWKILVAIVYIVGLLFFILRFGFQIGGFWKLIKENPHIHQATHTIVLMKEESLPFTFLNYLFVSKSTYENDGIENEIIIHEMAHIQQKHSFDILALEVLRCIFWFNPILLLYKKAIQLNHEFLADEAVNKSCNDIAAYQWLLYSKVQNFNPNFPLCSPFNYSVTAKRLKIMGSKTDPIKAALIKSLSMVLFVGIIFALSPIKNSFAISIPFMDSSPEEYESIISAAFDNNQPYKLDLSKLDLVALQKAYQGLSEEGRGEVTEFPFFEPEAFRRLIHLQQISDKVQVSFLYNSPPEKNKIKPEVWRVWKENKKVQLEIDEELLDISVLDEYAIDDFSLFEVREIQKKGFLKKPSFSVKLTTHDHYHKKFILRQKELRIISAVFEDGNKGRVYYSSKFTFARNYMNDPSYEPFIPDYFEASVLDAFINFDLVKYRKSNIVLLEDLKKEIQIQIWIDDRWKGVFVPIIKMD